MARQDAWVVLFHSKRTFLRMRHVLRSGGLAKWDKVRWYDAHQHPPLTVVTVRGKSIGILFGVSRECVLCESVSSDALEGQRGAERTAGDALLEAVSEVGDGLADES